MDDSIFSTELKEAAKKLVAASDKHYKQTQALNIIAKMDGFESYDECLHIANTPREFEKLINTRIESIAKEWAKLKGLEEHYFDTATHELTENHDNVELVFSYLYNLVRLLEGIFIFNDGSKLILEVGHYELEVFKGLLNATFYNDDEEEEEALNILKEKFLVQGINFNMGLIREKAISMNPKKFIAWFKKCFDLKYNFFTDFFDAKEYPNRPVNKKIKVSKTNVLYLPGKLSMGEKVWELMEGLETDNYLAEIDFEIPHHKIKFRLSYSFCIDEIEKPLFNEKALHDNYEVEDGGEDYSEDKNFLEYASEELITPHLKEGDDFVYNMFNSTNYENAFAHSLVGIQFCKSNEEFKCSIGDYFKDNNYKESFYEYLGQIGMIGTTISPDAIFKTWGQDDKEHFMLQLLKESNLNRYECIRSCFDSIDINDNEDIFGGYEEIGFNYHKDLTYSVFKYVFSSLDESLPYVVDREFKYLFNEVTEKILTRSDYIKENDNILTIYKTKFIHELDENDKLGKKRDDLEMYLFELNPCDIWVLYKDKEKNTSLFEKYNIPQWEFGDIPYDESRIHYDNKKFLVYFEKEGDIERSEDNDCTIAFGNIFIIDNESIAIGTLESLVGENSI